MSTFEVRVAASADDAEESGVDSSISLTGAVLDMGSGDNTSHVAMRFDGVTIPQGALITNAYIQFYAHASTSGAVDMDIYGEDVDDSVAFTTATGDISGRTLTTAKIDWTPSAWTINTTYQVTGLESIIQEIVDRGGWSSGNALSLIFVEMASSDRRRAKSYDGDAANAALIHIEYSLTTTGSQDIAISTGTDDATEIGWSGAVDTAGTNIPIGEHYVGVRFPGVNAPQGATITNAYVTFDSSGGDTGPCTVAIWCEDSDDAATFAAVDNDITDRTLTAAQADWVSIPAWTSLSLYSTPELKTIVQEVVDRSGWSSGNAIAFVFGKDSGGARRRARTQENSTGDNPTLHIEWDTAEYDVVAVSTVAGARESVSAAAQHSAGVAVSKVYGAYESVEATVIQTAPAGGIDIGFGLSSVRASLRHSITVADRGGGLSRARIPLELKVTAADRSGGRDVGKAAAAAKTRTGAVEQAYSLNVVTVGVSQALRVEALDMPAGAPDAAAATATAGVPADPELAGPGMVTGIIHQLHVDYRAIFGS